MMESIDSQLVNSSFLLIESAKITDHAYVETEIDHQISAQMFVDQLLKKIHLDSNQEKKLKKMASQVYYTQNPDETPKQAKQLLELAVSIKEKEFFQRDLKTRVLELLNN